MREMLELLLTVGSLAFSLLIGWIYLPKIILIAKKKKLFDAIDERKVHVGSVPRIGGIAFFPIVLLTVSVFTILRYLLGCPISGVPLDNVFVEMLCFTAGLTIMYIVGLADDLTGVRYKIKFLFQFFASLCIISSGLWVHDLQGILGIHKIPFYIGIPITVLAFMFVMNAYNLIDGIDGLCSGLSLLAIGLMGFWFAYNRLFFYGMIAAGIMGVLIVFFFYNTYGKKSKVFMGDTGSVTLGFIIAFLGIKLYNLSFISDWTLNFHNPAAAILGIAFIPIFDALRVFCARIAGGLSPFFPDKRHIHHKFLRLGFTHVQSTFIIMGMQLCYVVFNTIMQPLNINIIIFIDILIALTFLVAINYVIRCKNKQIYERTK